MGPGAIRPTTSLFSNHRSACHQHINAIGFSATGVRGGAMLGSSGLDLAAVAKLAAAHKGDTIPGNLTTPGGESLGLSCWNWLWSDIC